MSLRFQLASEGVTGQFVPATLPSVPASGEALKA
jgi:hypothetical protein